MQQLAGRLAMLQSTPHHVHWPNYGARPPAQLHSATPQNVHAQRAPRPKGPTTPTHPFPFRRAFNADPIPCVLLVRHYTCANPVRMTISPIRHPFVTPTPTAYLTTLMQGAQRPVRHARVHGDGDLPGPARGQGQGAAAGAAAGGRGGAPALRAVHARAHGDS